MVEADRESDLKIRWRQLSTFPAMTYSMIGVFKVGYYVAPRMPIKVNGLVLELKILELRKPHLIFTKLFL